MDWLRTSSCLQHRACGLAQGRYSLTVNILMVLTAELVGRLSYMAQGAKEGA